MSRPVEPLQPTAAYFRDEEAEDAKVTPIHQLYTTTGEVLREVSMRARYAGPREAVVAHLREYDQLPELVTWGDEERVVEGLCEFCEVVLLEDDLEEDAPLVCSGCQSEGKER